VIIQVWVNGKVRAEGRGDQAEDQAQSLTA
jgi:hypothetical protein